jgi:hypothetical protein
MFGRFCSSGLLLICLGVFVIGCEAPASLTSIAVTPTTVNMVAGSSAQLTAMGSYSHGSHPVVTQDITSQVTWTSTSANVATVSASGLVTGVGAGTVQITASAQGFTGLITNSTNVTVTGASSVATETFTSLTVIPGSQSVASPQQTSQFIAIGTTNSGATVDLTNSSQIVWNSSSKQIAIIDSATGLATAEGQGTATITALYTNTATNTVVTGTATFQVLGGAAEQITALNIIPGTMAATAAAQQSQFFVLGTSGSTGLQYDETSNSQLTWTSSNHAVATIGSSNIAGTTPGLATAVGNGETTITATWTNQPDGSLQTATAAYTVTIGAAQETLLSINVVPAGTTVSNKGMTGQYLAFGSFSITPTLRDITNGYTLTDSNTGNVTFYPTTWLSMLPEVASINSGGVSGEIAGLATAEGYTGNTVIYAEATNPDGTVVVSNPQTFTCKDPNGTVCDQGVATPQFATITVFVEGENTTPGYVTAPSGTGTADLIHCGPGWTGSGGQVCTGTYETGSTVTLTETGSTFGGWSSGTGCGSATTCTVTLLGNETLGVIFY